MLDALARLTAPNVPRLALVGGLAVNLRLAVGGDAHRATRDIDIVAGEDLPGVIDVLGAEHEADREQTVVIEGFDVDVISTLPIGAEELDGLDVLVTVVGGQLAFVPVALAHEMADDDWDLMFDLNLRYVAEAVRAALRVFLAQGTGGTIVSIGSIAGLAGSPGQAAYGAAKAGLANLARSVAVEYGRDGIRMNVVACGPIATPVAAAAQAGTTLDWIPLGRAGSAHEVADAAIFLASPLSSYISGQSLVVDGGATAAGPFPPIG